SQPAEARVFRSGENARPSTPSLCPSLCPASTASDFPVAASHKRTVLSQLPVARVLPSGENATATTAPWCPRSKALTFLDETSHNTTSPGRLATKCPATTPMASVLPSGEKETALQSLPGVVNAAICRLDGSSHKRAVLSKLAAASVRLSGENATEAI